MTEEQKQQRIVELEGRTNATAGGDRRRRTVDRDVRGSQAAIWCLLDAPERSDSLIGLVGAPFIATPCRSAAFLLQFGRASMFPPPHLPHFMRGRNDGTSVSAG